MKRLRLLPFVPVIAIAATSLPKYMGVLSAIFMICALIFLHEFGHFLFAKRMGLPVETFSLGFGTRLIGFKWKETDIRLSAIPLGGYVKLAGYNPEEPDADDPHGFLKQPYHRRMLFYAGGVIANIVTAVLLLSAVGMDEVRILENKPLPSPLVIMKVVSGMPADKAGLQPGDLIHQFGELAFPGAKSSEVPPYVGTRSGQTIAITIEREGKRQTLQVIPEKEKVSGEGKLGISFVDTKYEHRPFQAQDLWRGPWYGIRRTLDISRQMIQGLGRLVSFQASVREVGGPIAIVKGGSDAAQSGWIGFCTFVAFISLNLAILNALPIPILDGGHMAMLTFEKLCGRDLTLRIKERILMGGLVFLASLMAFVIALDLWKLRH